MASAMLSGQFNNPTLVPSLSITRSVLGGILMIIGARVAGGCTSGHGLTGSSELGIESFIALIGMFATGIITGMIFRFA